MSFVWENMFFALLPLLIPVAIIIWAVLLIVRSKQRTSQLQVRIDSLERQVDELKRLHAGKQGNR